MIDAEEIANRRSALHNDHASSRPLSEGYNLVGIAGEIAFGKMFGLMPDVEDKPAGDSGVDFMLPLALTVDVKTARKPGHLIHEAGKPFADIFVLAQFDDETGAATCIGWETGSNLRAAPVRDFGYGVKNHYIDAKRLRPMSALTKKALLKQT